MNRMILTLGGVLSASSLLLMDSAIKGTVLLSLAAVLALLLRRDSAATRHLVWLTAIVALLVVPVLSATLPQWRLLPNWMSSPRTTVAAIESASPPALPMSAVEVIELPQRATSIAPMEVDPSAAPDLQPVAQSQVLQPTMMAPREIPAQVAGTWSWMNAIPLVWAIGFGILMLRLSAARWMLWNSERLAIVIGRQEASRRDPIVIAMTALCSKLKIRRPITLLIHPHKTIPVVWGIFRCRLMLPVAARQWSDEQLQSVLMHELAHIKRGDTLVQLLTQVACALHWFNPLVWFAAWRLDVERERSCDDLVLASGIRPSAYAAHLLDVVSGLSPARWTQACGLAMARKSSLEGRLAAVLGKDLNRRSVSLTLAGLALLIAVGLVVPIAMLRAGDENWNPPSAAHVSNNDFSTYCVHDAKEAAYVIAYHGRTGSSTSGSNNSKSRTWNDNATLTLLDTVEKREFTLGRDHTAPNKLTLDGKDYDLGKGRVFLLADNGRIRQIDIATPPVTARDDADRLAKLLAKTTPSPMKNRTGKLNPQTIEKLKWGEPVNGLRMALAFPPALNDPLLGEQEFYQLVVQNVSEKAVRYTAGDNAPNPRSMIYREGKRIVQVLSDDDAQRANWNLAPGECGVLWLFTKEERNKHGKTVSSLLDNDLPSDARYHVVVSMEITQAPEGAWTGKLVTGELRSSEAVAAPPTPMPSQKDARALFEVWQRYARSNGDIPGGLMDELAAAVKQFIKYNPTWETVPKLNELLPRLDETRDWKPTDAIAILDEVAAIQGTPLSMALDNDIDYVVRTGKPQPKELAEAQGVWGPADEDGLRVVWDLQPRRDLEVLWAKHASVSSTAAFGDVLKARILVHNSGEKPIVVRVPTFLQCEVTADDQERKAVECQGIHWTRESRLYTCRLAPGEYVVIDTPGIGFGKEAGRGPWAGSRVGWNVMAQPGDSVTLKHASVPLDGSQSGRREDAPFAEGPDWWPAFIKARLGRELPLPNDATERARILERAANELFGSAPTADEREAFAKVADENSLSVFIAQLAKRSGLVSFFGKLQPEVTSFKIVAADANADKQPRVVFGPGEYPLPSTTATRGDATLKIVGRPVGDRRTNDAQLLFEPVEFTGARPPDPHKLDVPDGWRTWAIVCRPSDGYFYLLHKGTVRKIDYSKPRSITDTPTNDLPVEFRDEVKRQLDIAGVSAEQQAEIFEKPVPLAVSLHTDVQEKLKAAAAESQLQASEREPFTAWGKEVNGLQAGLGFKVGEKRAFHHGETANVVLRVRNVGKDAQEFKHIWAYFVENPPVITDAVGKPLHSPRLLAEGEHGPDSPKIAPGKAVELYEWKLELKPETPRLGRNLWASTLYGTGKFGLQCERIVGPTSANPHDPNPAMSELATGKLELEVKEDPTAWGQEVGGLQAGFCITNANDIHIGGKVKAVVKLRNVSNESISVTTVPFPMLFSPTKVVDFQDKPVRTTDGPYPLLHIGLKKLTLQPGDVVDVDKTEIPVAELNQEVEVPDQVAYRQIIHVEPGKYKVNCIGFVQEHSELSTGSAEFEAKAAMVRLEMKGTGADGKNVVLMSFEELQRDAATSTVRIKSVGVGGGSVGSPMFIVRGACEIAKARGAAYFANLKEWDAEDGTRMYLIGFSKNKDIRPLTNDRQLQIFSVGQFEFLFKDPADANIVTVPDDQYLKSGVPVDELAGEGVIWNDVQNGLSLGYRITSDEWRILGKEVKVELWVQNHGDKDVKFQDNMRPDPEFGLRVKLKDAKGEVYDSNFWPDDRPPFGLHRLLTPGHALKVKEFTISLFLPENDFSYAKGHFFGINPGAYNFHCELELPGFSATGEGGKQLTPAAGEWKGKLTTRGLNVEVIAPDAPASKPRIESVDQSAVSADLEKAAESIRRLARLSPVPSNKELEAAINLLVTSTDNNLANRLVLQLANHRISETTQTIDPIRLTGFTILMTREKTSTLAFLRSVKSTAPEKEQRRIDQLIGAVERSALNKVAPQSASKPKVTPKERRQVATFFEEPVYQDQLEGYSTHADRLLELVTRRLTADYRAREKLTLKEEWIEALAKVVWQKIQEKPQDELNAKLSEEQRFGMSHAWGLASMQDWLLTKSLYERYGGRVGFGSLGLWLAPDGRNALIKEAIEAGNFKIHDSELEKAFWENANKKNFADAYPTGEDLKRYLSYPPQLGN